MSQSLAQDVKASLGVGSVLANSIANFVSPASSDTYTGLADNKKIRIAALKDNTEYEFGNGMAFPGYETPLGLSGVSAPVPRAPTMAAGSTWDLLIVLVPMLTLHGFWRMEYDEEALDAQGNTVIAHRVRVGVLPTPNKAVRDTVIYYFGRQDDNSDQIVVGSVAQRANSSSLLETLAGRIRLPASSLTSKLNAPDLANQGMISSSLLGQSFDSFGQTSSYLCSADGSTNLITPSDYFQRPMVIWTGPAAGYGDINIQQVKQLMSQDTSTYVTQPLKEGGRYDIARSADLNWHQGIMAMCQNPLYIGSIWSPGGPPQGYPNLAAVVPDFSVAPKLLAFTGVSAQSSIVSTAHVLIEIEPELGSVFVPFKGFPPTDAGADVFLKSFVDVASTMSTSWPADANDTGLLAKATKSVLRKIKSDEAHSNQMLKVLENLGGLALQGRAQNGGVRNERKSKTRVARAEAKARKAEAKYDYKSRKVEAKRGRTRDK